MFRKAPKNANAFTMHKKPGYFAIVGVLLFLSCVEIPVIHLLLDAFLGVWVAWCVTILSLYGLVWIWGDAQAMRLHPTVIDGDVLKLRVGLRWRGEIPLSSIAAIEAAVAEEPLKIAVFGAPTHAMVLREPVTLKGPFGITRTSQRIAFQIDEPTEFIASLRL